MFEGSFPPLLGVEQFENRLPPAFPGIQGEGESEGSSIEGALLYWPEGAPLYIDKREEPVARCLFWVTQWLNLETSDIYACSPLPYTTMNGNFEWDETTFKTLSK